MSQNQQVQKYLKQYQQHVQSLPNGDKIILIGTKVRDVFTGHGWRNHRRERLVNGKWVYQHGG
jgi:hypothetical protein